jgi:hypothetical protein
MAEPDGSGMSARLWRLPGQLLLALINATAILVIVAAIVALVAIAQINRFAENVAVTMTDAAVESRSAEERRAGEHWKPGGRSSHAWQHHSRNQGGEHPLLQPELAQLKESLTVLSQPYLGSSPRKIGAVPI